MTSPVHVWLFCLPSNIRSLSLSHLQMQLRENQNDVQLPELLPNTAYALSLFALHGNDASAPLNDQGVTCRLTYIHIQTIVVFYFLLIHF